MRHSDVQLSCRRLSRFHRALLEALACGDVMEFCGEVHPLLVGHLFAVRVPSSLARHASAHRAEPAAPAPRR